MILTWPGIMSRTALKMEAKWPHGHLKTGVNNPYQKESEDSCLLFPFVLKTAGVLVQTLLKPNIGHRADFSFHTCFNFRKTSIKITSNLVKFHRDRKHDGFPPKSLGRLNII